MIPSATIGVSIVVFLINLGYYAGVYLPQNNYLHKHHNMVIDLVARQMLLAVASDKQVILVTRTGDNVYNLPTIEYFLIGKDYRVIPDDGHLYVKQTNPS